MRKIHLVSLALVAVAAFSAVVTASAFALAFENAKWLVDGAQVTENLAADAEGELLFKNVLNNGEIVCSGLFEGTIGPEGKDEITMVFDLLGRLIEELAGEGLVCKKQGTCEEPSPSDILIWPTNLPWLSQAELDTEDGTFWEMLDGTGGNPGYHIECLVLGIKIEELCEVALGRQEVLNLATDVELMGEATPLGACNGNAEDGAIFAVEGNLMSVAGHTLAISE